MNLLKRTLNNVWLIAWLLLGLARGYRKDLRGLERIRAGLEELLQ